MKRWTIRFDIGQGNWSEGASCYAPNSEQAYTNVVLDIGKRIEGWFRVSIREVE